MSLFTIVMFVYAVGSMAGMVYGSITHKLA